MRLHYRDEDGVVHQAEQLPASQSWCQLLCEPGRAWVTAKGDVALPVTCIACLATQTVDDE